MAVAKRPLFDPPIVRRAIRDAFAKLTPAHMVRNPVMFVVLVGSVFTTCVLVREVARRAPDLGFILQLTLWLWFTVLFANFAEAMAEGRGKAQADTLRKSRTETTATLIEADGSKRTIAAPDLRKGDVVYVVAGEFIPGDGEVIEGVA